jgi:Zn-dependent peptidase ImmA (M78 family)
MTVNPTILEWARETAGLSPHAAAKVLGFSDTNRRSAAERLAALEGGEDKPSRGVLLKMAEKYRRPLLVFYLEQPPPKGDRGQDFRTVPEADLTQYNLVLDALIRDVHGRQGIVRSLLEEEDATPLDFVGSATPSTLVARLAREIPDRLGFSIAEFRRQSSPEHAFSYLRGKLEASGVFVLLVGNLGSHHTNIDVDVFRGFAIADAIAPLIVVNDNDSKTAWSFTALHEAVHLWLGETGVSNTSTETKIEKYCNEIAGAILLPDSDIEEFAHLEGADLEAIAEEVSRFARPRNLSRAMVAYKLLRSGRISVSTWKKISAQFKNEWVASKNARSDEDTEKSRPNYYVVRRHRLGPELIKLAKRSLAEGALSYTKAARLLGVKPRNIAPLLRATAPQSGRR